MPNPFDLHAIALGERYRFERELGAGGMATVYLAEDIRHKRKVAIKVLHPDLAAVVGGERFLREIEITANLQHPHILPLFDSGEADGLLFYVMPFVEGETLRARLQRERQLSIMDAVRIAGETADALEYAHKRGVIHRDIKPENILLHDGRALVADFGIALAVQQAGGARLTGTGVSIGTPQYMAPEQAMGDPAADARVDVYALGCVVYEMLTGVPPFSGPSLQAIVANVMATDPAVPSALRRTIPPHVEGAVLQAMEKLPADRFESAAAFRAALQDSSVGTVSTVRAPGRRRLSRVPLWVPWSLLVATLAFVVVDRVRGNQPAAAAPMQRYNIVLPDNASLIVNYNFALSPDGQMLAYSGRDSLGQRLYLRAMDRAGVFPIPDSYSSALPVFSTDGKWIAFVRTSRLMKAPTTGGAAEFLCNLPGFVHATWLEDGTIVFGDGTGGLRQCSPSGEVSTLAAAAAQETYDLPHALPGDRGVLFTIRRGTSDRIAVFDLRSRRIKHLDIVGSDPRFVSTGHLVYATIDGAVHAARFDLRSLTPSGESMTVMEGVPVSATGQARFALARNGTMATIDDAGNARALELVDRQGRARRVLSLSDRYGAPRFSSDGRRIVLSIGTWDIRVLDLASGSLTSVSPGGSGVFSGMRPFWTRDGRRIAFIREIGGSFGIHITAADGSAPPESLLTVANLGLWHGLFAPDGQTMIVRTVGGPGGRDISMVRPGSAPELTPLLRSPANEVTPSLSPNGRWLAYASDESGRLEVYVRSFPSMTGRQQVSLAGGTEPVWSPAGRELFYRVRDTLVSAEVRADSHFRVERRVGLFSNSAFYDDGGTYQEYDVSPDATRFVMIRNLGGRSDLSVTLNLFENLYRR